MTEYTVKNNTETSFTGRNDGKVLTTTLWNQRGDIYVWLNDKYQNLSVDYNAHCPMGYPVDEEEQLQRTITGCTNTADSSLVYYWIEQGYTFDFTVTAQDYYVLFTGTKEDRVKEENQGQDPTKRETVYLSETEDEKRDTLTISELNDLLNKEDLMQNVANAKDGDSDAVTALEYNLDLLGNFIAALNFYCGVKNHSEYGTDVTWTSWWPNNDNKNNNLVYRALGFDSYNHITLGYDYVNSPDIFDAETNTFTEYGYSLLRENLDYGEVIRVNIPGHAIYMDGYKYENGQYYYHLNYGWGSYAASESSGENYKTKWYSEEELTAEDILSIDIDLSPDINVVVSSDKSDRGGSFKRGMQRVNNVQNERRGFGESGNAVEFEFDESVHDANITIDTFKINSKCDVEFKNINANLTTNVNDNTAFQSDSAMSFELNDGSISVIGTGTRNVIFQNGDKQVILTLDDSFIYTGNYSSTENTLVGILDEYTWSDLTSDLTATISGNVVNSGSADDIVTLKGNSALLGNLYLGAGNNVLNVESGSTFYGGYTADDGKLEVNLTVNAGVTEGTMLNITEGDENFWKAAGNTLYVTVESMADKASIILYSGSSINDVKVCLTLNGATNTYTEDAAINNDEYKLHYDYDNGEIVLAYKVKDASVGNVTHETIDGSEYIDGWTRKDVKVTAEFSENTARKYYYISQDGSLTPDAIGQDNWLEFTGDSVTVEENGFIYFKAENSVGTPAYSTAYPISCIDKVGPSFEEGFVFEPMVTKPTNTAYGISIGYENPDCVDWKVFVIKGEEETDCTEQANTGVLTVDDNCKIKVVLYDKLRNSNEHTWTIENFDLTPPESPIIDLPEEGAKPVNKIHLDVNFEDGAEILYRFKAETADGDEYSEWAVYDENVFFAQNGSVQFKVIDQAGNETVGDAVEITNIDNMPPQAPEVAADKKDLTNGNVVITVRVNMNDDFESFSWSTADESGTINKADIPQTGIIEFVAEKNTKYTFYTQDSAGNKAVAEYEVENIDKTAPKKPQISSIIPDYETKDEVMVTVNFAGDDIVLKQYCWVAGNDDTFTAADIKEEDWETYSGALPFPENGILFLRSIDHVGNVSEITRHVIDNIDRTNPAKPEIFTDSDGRVTDKPVNVWADYGERKVVSIKYSTDKGNTWKVFDPGKPIELQENQKPEDISISLRAEDKAGNRSREVEVTLDSKGMVAEMPEWQWTKPDAVNLEILGEDGWEVYTPGSKIPFSKNGTVFFRAVDAAGNYSDTVEYRVNNIDTVADAVGKSKIFIDSKYTAANTQGKFQDGVLLVWGETAFSSMEEARNKYDFSTQDVIIVANNLKSEDVDNLDGVKQLSAIQVTPSGSLTDHNYSYQSKGKAEKSFSLAGKNYSELELKWFKDVSLSSNSKVRSVEGGNAEHKSRQQYSKDGSSLTRHSSSAEAANGFFEASGEAAAGDVSGFLTVETANAKIGNLAGGKSSSVEDSKTVKKANQEKHSISLKESVAAAGKALLKDNTILGEENQRNGNIENYKDVEVQSAIIYGLISNNKIDLQQSETLTRSSNKFNRNIAIKQNLSTDGTLQVDSSRITGGIQGYNEVILTSSQVGDVSRQSEGKSYGKEKKNWKISQDAKTGAITGKLTASMRSVNGGSISVSGNGATTDNISNFSKVTVVGGTVKDITNNTLLQSETSFLYNWASADAYGEQFDYKVNTDNCNNFVVLKVVEKQAANGQVLIQDDAVVGKVTGFAKVVVEGKGTLTSITAINDDIYGIRGSLTLKMADNRKTKNGVSASGTYTNVVTLKPAASVKVTGYTVNGDIAGYKSVAITKATVGGNVDMGNAYTLKDVTSYKTSKGIVTKTYTTTQTFTNGGKISLKDTKVTGDVKDYATATLDNTQTTGNITNKTAVKIESKYSQTWDALELQRNPDTAMTLDEFMAQVVTDNNAVLLSSFDKYAANGSVTLKNKSTAGNISGYKTVKLEGEALDGKTEPLKVGAITAVSYKDNVYGSYQRKMTNKVSDSTGNSGTMTENITVASAGSVTVFGYDVNGDISGYKTVKLEDVNVAGDIVQGDNYTQKITTVYSTDSQTIDTVTTSKQTGTFKATDVIAQKADNTMGAVIGYNKVELKSSKVGDIYQDRVTKETSRVIWDGGEMIFDEVISQTTKISGSVKLTDSVAGDISNYSSVTLDNSDAGALTNVNKVTVKGAYNSMDGFVGTDKNDTITIGKGAVLRMGGAMDFGNGKDKITIDGTLVLENIPPAAAGESVNIVAGLENVAGKGIIAADAELFKDVSVSLINSFGGTLMNLGNTSTGFRGSEFEKADDTKSGAVEWDGIAAYDGWLGTGDDIDCNDAVDFIRLVAEKDSVLSITMTGWEEGDTVSIADTEYVIPENGVIIHNNIKGGAAYIIEINRKAENSMSYTMSIA